ncbi:hypothetical protein HDU96_006023 [Phlyctochytrium bullatum]|nr:hypothetical protein HDU96_006023 [Phlyctochytrium bullatum]
MFSGILNLPLSYSNNLDRDRYVKEKNRPYSATDVFNNLKGVYPKGTVQKILAQLCEEGVYPPAFGYHHGMDADGFGFLLGLDKIKGKAYGKQWVYVAKQDPAAAATPQELEELDKELETLKTGLAETKAKFGDFQTAEMQERLTAIRNGQQLVSEEERNRINKDFDNNRLLWRQRKKMFMNAWNTITENLPQKPAELMEVIGIETDEMAGVDINADPLEMVRKIQSKTKR